MHPAAREYAVTREKPEEALDFPGDQRFVLTGEHNRDLLLHVRPVQCAEQNLAQARYAGPWTASQPAHAWWRAL